MCIHTHIYKNIYTYISVYTHKDICMYLYKEVNQKTPVFSLNALFVLTT